MSLESAIADLIGALNANTAALKGASTEDATPATPATPATTGRKRRSAATAAPTPEAPAVQQQAPPEAKPVTLKEWTDVFVRLGEKNRDAAIGILKHFGAERASLIKPDQYAEAIKMAQALETAPPSAQSLV